ncbi:MAG: hypothetical protein R3335_00760 [Anaerolineales bacterium]|nr:hypothetical protein [Anaerolineales bacterium]
MEWLDTFIFLSFGFVLRFAVPLLITIAVIIWLRWLDSRWQQEANRYIELVGKASFWEGRTPCWDANNCSEERRSSCPAYQDGRAACWQVLRGEEGQLKDECLGCSVFLNVAPPVPA